MADNIESRFSWNAQMERRVLEYIHAARINSSLHSGKGLKKKAWTQVTKQMEDKYQLAFGGKVDRYELHFLLH